MSETLWQMYTRHLLESGLTTEEVQSVQDSIQRLSIVQSELWGFELQCEKDGVKPTISRFKKYLEAQGRARNQFIKERQAAPNTQPEKEHE